jgi:hypothetical protein
VTSTKIKSGKSSTKNPNPTKPIPPPQSAKSPVEEISDLEISPADALKRRNSYSDKGTSTCDADFGWLVGWQKRAFQCSGSSVQYQNSTRYELPRSASEHHPPLGLVATSTARILRNAPQYLPAHTGRHHRAVPGSPPRSLLRATG